MADAIPIHHYLHEDHVALILETTSGRNFTDTMFGSGEIERREKRGE
jgi:hypothetical protein